MHILPMFTAGVNLLFLVMKYHTYFFHKIPFNALCKHDDDCCCRVLHKFMHSLFSFTTNAALDTTTALIEDKRS